MKNLAILFFALISISAFAQSKPIKMHKAKKVSSSIIDSGEGTSLSSFGESSGFAMASMAGGGTVNGGTSDHLSVSLSGGVNYAVPIDVPPGLNGVQPEISLAFDSQSGNGLAGWGWNVSGISVITRIPSTMFHENIVDHVDFDLYDRFALDGQRLIVKTGDYGTNGAVYQTEQYSNLKIISYGTHPDSGIQGPSYFKVFYPDGSIGYYGNSSGSRTQTDYAITYWENPQGIRISYTYNKQDNSLSIDKITYGSRGTATPINEIEFVYGTRSRAEQSYIHGINFKRKTILEEIKVKGDGTGYRNYVLTHDETSLGYNRLIAIREKTGDNSLSRSTIAFGYENTSHSVTHDADQATTLTLSNIEQRNANVVSMDFTGNGKMDFLVYPTYGPDTKEKFWLFTDLQDGLNYSDAVNTGSFIDIFPVNLMTHEYKLKAQQGAVVVQNYGSTQVRFRMYGETDTSPISNVYTKTWNAPTYNTESSCETGSYDYRIGQRYLSGDFDGDGLSDVLAISLPYSYTNCYTVSPPPGETCSGGGGPQPIIYPGPLDEESSKSEAQRETLDSKQSAAALSGTCCECNSYNITSSSVNLIKLDRRLTSNFAQSVGSLSSASNYSDQFITADVNGDGKTDVLKFTDSKVEVYSLNIYNSSMTLLWQMSDTHIDLDYPILPGDYNGDGKFDFMIPTTNNSYSFAVFLSKGNGYDKYTQTQPFQYKENTGGSTLYGYNLIPVDINGDSRTDILDYRTVTYNNSSNGSQTLATYKNTKATDTAVRPKFLKVGSTASASGNLEHYPIPIFLNSTDQPNNNLDFAAVSDKYIHSFGFTKDHREDVSMIRVVNNGVQTDIKYDQVNEFYSDAANDPTFFKAYESANSHLTQVYPFVNINVAPSFKVVRELLQTGSGHTRTQRFYYEGAVSHANGLGFMGFEVMRQSNWYGTGVDAIWTISKNDPMLRGKLVEQFVTDQFNTNNPTSYASKVEYFYDYKLIANQGSNLAPNYTEDITRNTAVSSALNDEAEVSITLSRGFHAGGTNADYHGKIVPIEEQPGDVGYAGAVDITLERMESENGLTGVLTTETYSYDQYNNPLVTNTTFSGGSKVVTLQYYNNAGSTGNTYHIGRLKNKKETVTLNGNSFSSEEQYVYSNNLVTQIKKKGNGTAWLTEAFTHDANGNVLTKTLSASGLAARTETFEYSSTYGGRFLTKSIDIEGLETTFTYDSKNGNLLSTTNPYGLTTSYINDKWDRVQTTTDYLGKNTAYTYTPQTGGGQKNNIEYPDGAREETIYNAFGWVTQSGTLSLNNQWIYTTYEHYLDGKVKRKSEPHNGSASQWSISNYDDYGRPTTQTLHTGRTITYSYSNLSSTVNDGVKSVTTTLDALGNTVQLQDPGGTIDYTYFANGTLKSADYGGHIITVGIDGWGRKTSLTDPSAGTYTYEYNDFGQLLEETTPNGTTAYVYDAFGKVTSKTMTGDLTDHSLSYVYDNTTKQLKTINGLDNTNSARAYTYQYTYDSYKRPSTITEDTGLASYEYRSTYDTYGRVSKETYISTLAGGATKTIVTRNEYDTSGLLTEIWNDGTPDKLWELGTINARGQALTVNLGNGIVKTKTYDSYGYLTEIEDKEGGTPASPTVALHTEYSFNTQRGILNSRDNHGFNWQETFTHDNLDRLTAISGDVSHTKTFDTRGRINVNSALGTYEYTDTSKKYRLMEIDPNTPGETYFQQHPTQQITYNAFKKPIDIHQSGHGRVSFEYGPMMSRSTSYYGGEQSDKSQRRYKKHYSSIIPVEIVEDTQAGTTKILTYIGGDGYTAPIVHIKTTGTGALDEYHYLHRDYLGSILAITDADGDVVEERQFGAWGVVDHFLDSSNGMAFTHASLLGRGYTGHEHFFEVSLIHMNGRMYDAELGRFLSPDNFIQDPYNTQNYNRYGYVLNNPLIIADPSGEFFWVAVAIGALVGGVSQAVKPGANFGSILGGALIGAAAGAVGAGVGNVVGGGSFFGSQIANTMGFGQGFLSGFAGGFAGGFIGGAGNAWLGGANFGDGLVGGLKAGGIGGVAGGLINGISSGLRSIKHNGNFWNGKGATYDYTVSAQEVTSVEVGDGMEYSSEYAEKFSDANFGEVEGVDNLYADGSMPNNGEGYTKIGDRVYSKAYGEEVRASTTHLGKGRYNVHIYKAAFTSKEQLYLTMGHEYQHIGYDLAGVGTSLQREHYGIRRWEYYQAKQWNWNASKIYNNWLDSSYRFYNPALHHENFSSRIFNIIKNRPVLPK